MPAELSYMGWAYTPDGALIRLGKNVRTQDWQVMFDTALPSWLTFTGSGTCVVTPIGTAGATGTCRVTSLATAASNNFLSMPPVDTTQFSEIGIYFDDLASDSDAISGQSLAFGLINVAANIGLGFGQASTTVAASAMATAIFENGTSVKEADLTETRFFGGLNVSQKKSYGMIYRPIEGAIYLVGNERQVLWRGVCSTPADFPTTTLLPPSIALYNGDGAAHWFQFTRIRLELVSG